MPTPPRRIAARRESMAGVASWIPSSRVTSSPPVLVDQQLDALNLMCWNGFARIEGEAAHAHLGPLPCRTGSVSGCPHTGYQPIDADVLIPGYSRADASRVIDGDESCVTGVLLTLRRGEFPERNHGHPKDRRRAHVDIR